MNLINKWRKPKSKKVDNINIGRTKDTRYIQIYQNDLKDLKRGYKEALLNDKEQFKFMGHDILTSYAKYLIAYIENRIG